MFIKRPKWNSEDRIYNIYIPKIIYKNKFKLLDNII